MSITAEDAREALNAVQRLIEDGLDGVVIIDEKGNPYDQVELERLTRNVEDSTAPAG
ncbi:hypothetical protein [Terrihabitans sp. B22-R8]|uniref:hypothetical protein n=1 Tax=Terrihabitans sp. B22-R8 TaxID=3425128 RepID=UPI00403C3539